MIFTGWEIRNYGKERKVGKWVRKAGILVFWLAVWQIASLWIHNSIILVGPVSMFQALWEQALQPDFWLSAALSFGKIAFGFILAFFTGICLGAASYSLPFLRELLEPAVLLLKAIPVASFVILALLWVGSDNLSVLISFFIVFPILYTNTIEGLEQTDRKLLEMAKVFRIPFHKKAWHIYRPALWPFLLGGCKIALGLSWKSGIAAEVIGVPAHSIGEKLYMAKIYLSTADLFAWTFAIIVICALWERLFLKLLEAAGPAGPEEGKEHE